MRNSKVNNSISRTMQLPNSNLQGEVPKRAHKTMTNRRKKATDKERNCDSLRIQAQLKIIRHNCKQTTSYYFFILYFLYIIELLQPQSAEEATR